MSLDWLKNPWAPALLAPLLVTGALWAFGWLPDLWAWVAGILQACLNWLVSDHAAPGWVWVIVCAFALAACAVIGAVCISAIGVKAKEASAPAPYLGFTELRFRGVLWRWRWAKGSISNLWCYCPACDRMLLPSNSIDGCRFFCEGCPTDHDSLRHAVPGKIFAYFEHYDHNGVLERVKREIDHQIRQRERQP